MSKKMKTNPKIYLLLGAIVLAISMLAATTYFTFFKDGDLKLMGYSYKEIELLKKYGIEEDVTTYNQSLLYALNSKEFKEENIEYYLIFNSQMDLTRVSNTLALDYPIEVLHQMLTYLKPGQIEELVEYDLIKDVDLFERVYKHGYSLKTSIELSNKLPTNSIEQFLALPVLENPNNYLTYLKNGYNDNTISAIYHQLGEEVFNDFAGMRYFGDSLIYVLVNTADFAPENLPRYLMVLNNDNKMKENQVVEYVNTGKDSLSVDQINYSSFYTNATSTADQGILTLVNKSHQLASSFMPKEMGLINNDYRYTTNSEITKEAATAFVQMADAYYEQTQKKILVYEAYKSYSQQRVDYISASTANKSDNKFVDSFIFKEGSSEHQTGLAVDICEKDTHSLEKFAGSKASLWLQENAYKYGYILRYLEGKEWLTGMSANDYHYRYVGVKAASTINKYNWTLEEYYYLFINN